MATAAALLTAEEYFLQPDSGRPTELVRGQIDMMNMPGFDHGAICAKIAFHLGAYLAQHDLGRVVTNDSGVITERDPDSVRGTDVAFYSYSRVPKGLRRPRGYPKAPPELVFEEKIVVASDAHLLEHEVFKFPDAVAGIVDRFRLGENLFRIDA